MIKRLIRHEPRPHAATNYNRRSFDGGVVRHYGFESGADKFSDRDSPIDRPPAEVGRDEAEFSLNHAKTSVLRASLPQEVRKHVSIYSAKYKTRRSSLLGRINCDCESVRYARAHLHGV